MCSEVRGYEMWLMAEAFKRNPDIATYILSWGVPNWVGNGSYFSAENIAYQVGYAKCVAQTLGSNEHPSYIGIWNERSWGTVDYVVSLRDALDAAGLTSTRIVVPDGGGCSEVTAAAKANSTFADAVYALGEHYPCRRDCPATAEVGMKFWASEDYSTVGDWKGAGCWGRSLNQNFVILNSTSTISWSTIWSVYPQDIYYGNGLMYAMSPWSGNYEVNLPIWTSAHHCQFMNIGWHLLQGGSSGMLSGGGSYVSATSPDKSDFTLVLETLQGNCLRCSGGPTSAQNVTFALTNGLPLPGTTLRVWQTTEDAPFVRLSDATVAADGTLTVFIPADAMVTVSTITTAAHGVASTPIPADAPFPLPYSDDFSGYVEDHLPRFFADQAGSFAVRNGALTQVAPADPGPNAWSKNREPYTLLGSANWTDTRVTVSVTFSDAPAGGAPSSALQARAGEPAAVTPCSATSTRWVFDSVAPGYLSTVAPAPLMCLNIPGCDPGMPLIYWDCVTTGCECGCPTFTNLQFQLGPGGALTTPLEAGSCVTLLSSGAIALKPCTASVGQVWTHNASSGALSVVTQAGDNACLTAPGPPPPPMVWAGVSVRAPPYPNSGPRTYDGYTLRLTSANGGGAWQVLSELTVLANGTMPTSFNSSSPHILQLTAKATTITAEVDGDTVWTGNDATYTMGQIALGSGYNSATFDNFSVAPA